MSKFIAVSGNNFVNIRAEKMQYENGIIFVWDKDNLVGVFDIGLLNYAYISQGRNESESE